MPPSPLHKIVRRLPPKMMSTKAVIDSQQAAYLDNDRCILVDEEDRVTGEATKRHVHRWENIEREGCLHRAFSVFQFNAKLELLLQKRSSAKITFPSVWTNTCCSHPLHVAEELAEGEEGVRRAARRKMAHELGITNIPLPTLHRITRIHYKAADGAREWGEHEMDHVLFRQTGEGEEEIHVNDNEVSDVMYVDRSRLKAMIADKSNVFSPWFLLIVEHHLWQWWDELHTSPDFLAAIQKLKSKHAHVIYRYV